MQGFKEFLQEDKIDYIEIELDESFLASFGLTSLSESEWRDTNIKGYMYRIDPKNTNTNTQRHIHIAKKKHINSKTQQVSWNMDGSRHDKHFFNDKINTKAVKKFVKKALDIGDSLILEDYQDIVEKNFNIVNIKVSYSI